jgi:enterochelin esterase-like enzyme
MTGKGRSGRFVTITILIGILSAFAFACRAHRGPIASGLPYDGTVWDNPPSPVPPRITHATYHSAVMNVDIGYNIYLPPQYDTNPTQSFPVIYFCHGNGVNESYGLEPMRTDLDSAISSGQLPPMFIVWLNAGRNSKYMDAAPGSPMYGVVMVETTIIHELIPHIDATYRTIASKEGRAIQGGSSGGMGSLRLAFKYPHLFSSVFGIAPAVDDNASNVMENEPELMPAMFNSDPNLWEQNTVFTIANNNAANIRGLPIHIVIGSLDSLLPYNQDLFATLDRLGIPHDPLEIISGAGHDQRVLDGIGIENLQFAAKYFVPPPPSSSR